MWSRNQKWNSSCSKHHNISSVNNNYKLLYYPMGTYVYKTLSCMCVSLFSGSVNNERRNVQPFHSHKTRIFPRTRFFTVTWSWPKWLLTFYDLLIIEKSFTLSVLLERWKDLFSLYLRTQGQRVSGNRDHFLLVEWPSRLVLVPPHAVTFTPSINVKR